ncbi:MAG: hypothetical protein ACJ739_09085 [Acidimicrobiales bacterium]
MDRLVAPGQLVGQRLDDRYHLLRLVKEDAVAEVYEADDERLERQVSVHVFDGDAPPDLAAFEDQEGGVLDAGEHDGRAFVVLPLADEPVGAATGPGDDEPTTEIPTAADHTAVLPVPLVPVDAPPDPAGEPPTLAATTGPPPPEAWRRRLLLGAIAAVALIVLLFGLAAGRDGVDVPSEATVPVSVETTTTTVAPTTTSPPTTQKPAPEHQGKGGKGKKGED